MHQQLKFCQKDVSMCKVRIFLLQHSIFWLDAFPNANSDIYQSLRDSNAGSVP